MIQKVPCRKCGAMILPVTAERTGGLCMVCKMGRTRRQSEPSVESTYWSHIEAAYQRFNSSEADVVRADRLMQFPDYVRDLVVVHSFLQEMENGGIEQYFLNPDGAFALETAEGFANMGLERTSDELRKCCARFGPPYPRDISRREVILCQITGATDPCDAMRAEPFKEEEEAIEAEVRQIVARMNAYAEQGGANNSPEATPGQRPPAAPSPSAGAPHL